MRDIYNIFIIYLYQDGSRAGDNTELVETISNKRDNVATSKKKLISKCDRKVSAPPPVCQEKQNGLFPNYKQLSVLSFKFLPTDSRN